MPSTEHDLPSPGDPSRRLPDVLARLEQAVGEIQDEDTFRAHLDVQARFHRYSWSNVALILAQCPGATQVAGYNAWLRMHRYVLRGEKAIKIIVPMRKKVESSDGEEESKLFFGVGNVFDVSQTDGEPLPQVNVPVLQGEEGRELYDRLEGLAARERLRVLRGEPTTMRESLMGYYDPAERLIMVKQAPQLQMTKTLAHELGHYFAGHGSTEFASARDEQETVAESVAYVTLSRFGLDSGVRSFPYVALWARDRAVFKKVLGTIQTVSAAIIGGVEDLPEDIPSEPPMAGGAPIKIYRGYSEDGGSAMGPEAVFIEAEDGAITRLKHEVHHSPDGFSWGYGGSGPADLARSLLADYLGYVPPPAVYQEFKRQYVARWEQGKPWQLSSAAIEAWLAQSDHKERLNQHVAWLREEMELRQRYTEGGELK